MMPLAIRPASCGLVLKEPSIHRRKDVVALCQYLTGRIDDDDIRRVTGKKALKIPNEIRIDLGVDDIGHFGHLDVRCFNRSGQPEGTGSGAAEDQARGLSVWVNPSAATGLAPGRRLLRPPVPGCEPYPTGLSRSGWPPRRLLADIHCPPTSPGGT